MGLFSRIIEFWKRKPKPVPAPTPVPVTPTPTPEPVPIQPSPGPTSPHLIKVAEGPFHPRLYSYSDWANAVVHTRPNGTYVFAGHMQTGPQFFRIAADGQVQHLGNPIGLAGTTEGWGWGREGQLYVPYEGILRRYWPISHGEPEDVFNIMSAFPGCRLWQCHHSDNGLVHSATVQSTDDWSFKATVVWNGGQLLVFPPTGRIDESQITPDGQWLVIKETDNTSGELFNRVIRLSDSFEYHLGPFTGRIGHSDLGNGFIVGEDSHIGAAVHLDLASRMRRQLFSTWNMGHVSVRGNRALFSRHELGTLVMLDIYANESWTVMNHGVIAPTSSQEDYDRQVRANLSPCGTRAAFTMHGDLYVLELR